MNRRLTAAACLAILWLLSSGVSATQAACTPPPFAYGCYNVIQSPPLSNSGSVAHLVSYEAGGISSGTYQHESWNGFANGGWIEGGAIMGSNSPSLRYFVVYYPTGSGGASYYTQWPNGPSAGSWYAFSTYRSGSTWCVQLNFGTVGCQPAGTSYPTYAQSVKAGLEYGNGAPLPAAISSGTARTWRINTSGQVVPTSSSYAGPIDRGWCYRHPSGQFPGDNSTLDFSTYQCRPASRSAVADDGRSFADAPAASFEPSTGEPLTDEELREFAYEYSRRDAGEPRASFVSIHRSSLKNAVDVLAPGMLLAESDSNGMRKWLASDVVVLTLRGRFRRKATPPPETKAEQFAAVMTMVIDARTSEINVLVFDDELPSGLRALDAGERARR